MGFAAMLADGITIGILSLSAAVPADVILMGFYLLSSSFVFLLGCGSGAGRYKIPAQQQALFVMRHLIDTL